MGISQVPPVPTPTVKGDIVVGTSSGPARLPVGTTNNQTLLVDSTTTTGLKYGATTLTTTVRQAPEQHFTITGFTYANPNITFTTSTNHNFQVGNAVKVNGVVLTGTTSVTSVNGSQTITAVPAANQFTANIGATAPSTYSSGGTASLYTNGEPNGYKFVNNTHVFFTTNGTYFYSTDAITWNVAGIPTDRAITGIDWDGTTYAISTSTSGIWTSPSLAQGSWTQRTAFGGFYCSDIKWCGGSVNRWVAVGSSDTTYNGAATKIEVAPSPATTWTNQSITTVSGSNSSAASSVTFDGSQGIIVRKPGGYVHSATGAASWNHYDNFNVNTYYRPAVSATFGWYNSSDSKWYGFALGNSQVFGFMSMSNPVSGHTKVGNAIILSSHPSFATNWYNPLIGGALFPDLSNNRFFSAHAAGGVLNITTWNSTPVSISSTNEYFVPISQSYAPNFLSTAMRLASTTLASSHHVIGYNNGKWLGLQRYSSTTDSATGFLIYVAE